MSIKRNIGWLKTLCCLISAWMILTALITVESFAEVAESSERIDILPGSTAPIPNRGVFVRGVSDNGRYVLFSAIEVNRWDSFLYIRDMQRNRTKLIVNDFSGYEYVRTLSASGRYVAFSSEAKDLVTGDTNEKEDVFLYDNRKDTIKRISVNSDGQQGNNHSSDPVISPDGRYVFYTSSATNLLSSTKTNTGGFFRYDMKKKQTIRLPLARKYTGGRNAKNLFYNHVDAVSRDGRYIAFVKREDAPGDVGDYEECYRYDTKKDALLRIPNPKTKYHTSGESGSREISISEDGRYITFLSSNEENKESEGDTAFLYDCKTEKYTLVATLNQYKKYDGILSLTISGNGRYAAYAYATKGKYNLHFCLYDRISGKRQEIAKYRCLVYDKDGNRTKFKPGSVYMEITISKDARSIGISYVALQRKVNSGIGYLIKLKGEQRGNGSSVPSFHSPTRRNAFTDGFPALYRYYSR